ncbi:MAG: RNA polymerase sigma factor, partial [Gemmatimonadaceae bacterium]
RPRARPAQLASTQPNDASDQELIERLARDDVAALDAILHQYWHPVTSYLARLLGALDAAEDIAQRTFYQLWERRAVWRSEGSLRGLVFRIARNFAVSEMRRRGAETRSGAVLSHAAIPSPLELLENKQLRVELERAIGSLPIRRREVVILRCVHELSYAEIAQLMGISRQTVANQLSSALRTLRAELRHLLRSID